MQLFWRELAEGRRHQPLLKGSLRLLSHLYGLALRCRRGVPRRATVPVISIGNIAVGGTGKTPIVMTLAQQLAPHRRIAVISRGYRGGDEARLMAQRLPDVAIYAGPDRPALARAAIDEGAQLILLDDGMQQRQLQVDRHIVALDGANPWGSDKLLPAGLLREPLTALQRADLVIVTRSWTPDFETQLRRWTQAPWVAMAFEPTLNLAGKRLGALCAIGRPWQFFEMLEQQGAQLIERLALPDHATPSSRVLKAFIDRCHQKGVDLLVCTEKDQVKLPAGAPFTANPIEPRPVHNAAHWDQFVADLAQCIVN